MNKLCFAIEDNVIKGISFDRNELSGLMYESTGRIQEITVLDLAHMFRDKAVKIGTDWLAINPVGYVAPIPSSSADAWANESG